MVTETHKTFTKVEIPFSDLPGLKETIKPLLTQEGIFIETQFPPPLGTPIEMVLVVDADRKEVARFFAFVEGHEPIPAELKGKKGVQLKFHEVMANAEELFSSLLGSTIAPEEKEEVMGLSDLEGVQEEGGGSELGDQDETLRLSNEEIQTHLIDASPTLELSSEDLEGLKKTSEKLEHLGENLDGFTARPDLMTDQEAKGVFVPASADAGSSLQDDFSALHGSAGYEMADIILGIDLGTCNSCVSVVQKDKARVISDDKSSSTTPSVVSYLEDGVIIVGKEAVSQMAKNPKTSIFGAKRFIGRNYHSPVVQKTLRFFPYKLVPDENNHTAIDIFGKVVSLESVSSEILKHMVNIAQVDLHQEIKHVIVTVPAYYNDNQRAAVKEAGVLAGLNIVRIINEPTAAALAVGFNQKMQKRLLIYDFGGGTFDVSILEIKDNAFKVLGTGGDNFLGGEDFDNRMVKWLLDESRKDEIYLARNAVTFERVKQACERAKIELSKKRDTSINLPYVQLADGKTINFQKKIDRERLVQLSRDLVERSIQLADEVLAQAKVSIKDIDEIILVGGMTRMPFIRNSVHQHYAKRPYGDVNPDEAVAMGAALLGGELTGSRKISLIDALSMSIGIALPRNRFKPILNKNSQVPCQKQYKISADLSSEFTIDVFQGESQKCTENEYLGTLVFSDEVKSSNAQSLEIEFALNNECLLNCTIRNPTSGKAEKALLITHDTPPSAKLA